MTEFERYGITLEYLRECFYYKDGKLFWKERPRHHFKTDWSWKRFNKNKPDTEVGVKHQSGYLLVNWVANGKKFINRCIDHNKYTDLSYTDKATQCVQAYEIFRYKEKAR